MAQVVVQRDMMYDDVIAELRPDYVIHGDNWCNPEAPEFFIRQNVESCLAKYGGRGGGKPALAQGGIVQYGQQAVGADHL